MTREQANTTTTAPNTATTRLYFSLQVRQHTHAVLGMLERRDHHFTGDAMKLHVDERLAHREIVNAQRFDADRKHRSLAVHFLASPIDAYTENRLQQHEGGTGRPCLRQTGDWIGCRPLPLGPREPTVEFGQPHPEMMCRLEDLAEDLHHLRAAAVV